MWFLFYCLSLHARFGSLPVSDGELSHVTRGLKLTVRKPAVIFQLSFLKNEQSHSKNQLSSDSFFYVHNYIVIEPKSWSERSIKGNRDHCKSQSHSLSPIHTWKPKNCLLPARSWFSPARSWFSVVFPKEWILSMIFFLLLCKETSHFRNPKYFWLLPARLYVVNN